MEPKNWTRELKLENWAKQTQMNTRPLSQSLKLGNNALDER